ncbi:MAG: TOBE domain-containing protein [Candidatus Bathyarchaeota archaeon]|nr:TOBE domain-containing protein [Candidatus Bathyarchaeota archaeon]
MNLRKGTAEVVCKIWLEHEGKPVLGRGGAEILEAIRTEESISKAAEKLGMSYRYVWNYLERMNKTLGELVIITFRGGRSGGGGAQLTEFGEGLLGEYYRMEKYVGELLADEEYWEAVGLKISARNRLEGTVKTVEMGDVTAKVKVEIEAPTTVTSLISREAVEELDIKPGDRVKAVIKATEVMIAKERPEKRV